MEGDIDDIDQILSRLSEIPGYIWELNIPPFHSVSIRHYPFLRYQIVTYKSNRAMATGILLVRNMSENVLHICPPLLCVVLARQQRLRDLK